jgi:SAM-dependent methyltransferase
MDLCEKNDDSRRHPWELARVNTLAKILEFIEDFETISKVLDVGCGDGFIAYNVLSEFKVERIDGVDINLKIDDIKRFSSLYKNFTFHSSFESLKMNKYNLILMLDVIEHIEDDVRFLNEIIEEYLDFGGYCLITVPAFNCMFSSHDKFLRHYRRYNIESLIRLIKNVNLKPKNYGYLFFSLAYLRLLAVLYERFTNLELMEDKGVGAWKYNLPITKAIASILLLENYFSINLTKLGIIVPGLTVWTLCKKQPS